MENIKAETDLTNVGWPQTVYYIPKLAVFRYGNGSLLICSDCGILCNTGNTYN